MSWILFWRTDDIWDSTICLAESAAHTELVGIQGVRTYRSGRIWDFTAHGDLVGTGRSWERQHIWIWWELRAVEQTAVVGACAVAHMLLCRGNNAIPAVLQTLVLRPLK